jgi:NSS family neurotransmitter:Na+ symporter
VIHDDADQPSHRIHRAPAAMSEKRETWSGRVGFIPRHRRFRGRLGQHLKFPYEVGANGGSAFVLFYLVGLIAIVVPLMFAEFAIGRSGRGDPVTSIAVVAAAHGASRSWAIAGALGVATGFVILSFYSVIGGWTIGHAAEAAFAGLAGSDPDAVRLALPAVSILTVAHARLSRVVHGERSGDRGTRHRRLESKAAAKS